MGGYKPSFQGRAFDRMVFVSFGLWNSEFRILIVLNRHRRRVSSKNQLAIEQLRRRTGEKLSRSISFIVGVYFLLNLPVLFVTVYHQILEQDIITYNHYSWSETLAFLNSCTNPLLCLWKNRQIRQGIMSLMGTPRILSRK